MEESFGTRLGESIVVMEVGEKDLSNLVNSVVMTAATNEMNGPWSDVCSPLPYALQRLCESRRFFVSVRPLHLCECSRLQQAGRRKEKTSKRARNSKLARRQAKPASSVVGL